jgi:uncharacterized protein (TIGR00369 family)
MGYFRSMTLPAKDRLHLLDGLIPFNRFLGLRVVDAGEGTARMELPYREEFIGDARRPALHGGVISTLIDTVAGFAVWTQCDVTDRISTIDMRVDYVHHGRPETLIADAQVVRAGNRIGVADVRVWQRSDPARTVATGKAVYNIRRGDD